MERRLLEMAALAGSPMPYEVLAEAAELDAGACLTRLGGLKAAQLARVTRRGDERLVEPYHDRLRESVIEHLAAADDGVRGVAERHLRLGRALRAHTTEAALPQRVFAILAHLHTSKDLVTERTECIGIAELHLQRAVRRASRRRTPRRASTPAKGSLSRAKRGGGTPTSLRGTSRSLGWRRSTSPATPTPRGPRSTPRVGDSRRRGIARRSTSRGSRSSSNTPSLRRSVGGRKGDPPRARLGNPAPGHDGARPRRIRVEPPGARAAFESTTYGRSPCFGTRRAKGRCAF